MFTLYRMLEDKYGFYKGDILMMDGYAHFCITRIGTPDRPTLIRPRIVWYDVCNFRKKEPEYKIWLNEGVIEPLENYEVRKLIPHLTKRIIAYNSNDLKKIIDLTNRKQSVPIKTIERIERINKEYFGWHKYNKE